jgi:hypothetical protein
MNPVSRSAAALFPALLVLGAVAAPAPASEPPIARGSTEASAPEVERYFERLEEAFSSGDATLLSKLLSSRFEDDFERDGRARMMERLASASGRGDRIEFDVLRVAPGTFAATAVVRTRVESAALAPSQAAHPAVPNRETELDFFILRLEDGVLVAARRLTLDEAAERRVTGRAYRAADASFDLTAPAGFAIATPRRKVGTAYDTVYLVDPESEAYALFVAFAIPFELDSLADLARLDTEKLASLADPGTRPRVVAEGNFSAAGLDGYQQLTHASVGGKEQVFRRVCLQRGRTCYQFLFRSTPPDAYARDAAAFDEILERFRPVQNAFRPRRGTVDGNLYRHGDVGFEIAAPPGWAIEEVPSSYTAQVFFTPGSGQSYAMVCALEIGHPIEEEALLTLIDEDERERRKTVPAITRRGPAEDGTVDSHPAKSVVQCYPVPGFERTVKSVYVAAGSTLFVIVLNAPPSEYDAIEPEFDALIASFIRTP